MLSGTKRPQTNVWEDVGGYKKRLTEVISTEGQHFYEGCTYAILDPELDVLTPLKIADCENNNFILPYLFNNNQS